MLPLPGIETAARRRTSIILDVSHPSQLAGPITGFRFLWAYYVNGYRPEKHCQPCFKGRRVNEFCTATASTGRQIVLDRMDRYPYLYVCGVAAGPVSERGARNLHLPLRYAEGASVEVVSYNGYRFRARNAERVEVPLLPDNWNGLARAHARCRNFQFAVSVFGYPPRQDDAAAIV
jgi:hypothetical protein